MARFLLESNRTFARSFDVKSRKALRGCRETVYWGRRGCDYLPLKEADWREETAKVKKHIIKADLIDEFHDVRLENIDKFTLQTHLNKLAKSRSKDRVLQIRAYMKAIFAEAVDQDFLAKDPARSIKTPSNLRESDKTTLTWDQLRSALAKLGLRDRILLKLDMTNALRPSELFGLKWKCFDAKASAISWILALLSPLHEFLCQLRGDRYRDEASPASSHRGESSPCRWSPEMDASNFRHRVLHKLAEELELPKLTF
jgi:integrase